MVCSGANAQLLSVTPAGAVSTLFSGSGLLGAVGVVVTTPGTAVLAVPTTPVPPTLLLTMTALLALTGFLFWKRRAN